MASGMATLIDGKELAKQVRGEVATWTARLRERGIRPGLAVVLVGDDPASAIYVRNKTRACKKVGIEHFDHHLPGTTTQLELLEMVQQLNRDSGVHGILVQLPLPSHIDSDVVVQAIDPAKDVDGLHPTNLGHLLSGSPRLVPCTPLGVMRLLERADTPLQGADAVVVGRSKLVGKPMAALLLARHCTVTICHSRTRDLEQVIRRADVLVAAVGRAGLVQGRWIKPGATVIDVGMNRVDGQLVGDVEFEPAAQRARAITPVPGGVGPMTIAMLMSNTAQAAETACPPAPRGGLPPVS